MMIRQLRGIGAMNGLRADDTRQGSAQRMLSFPESGAGGEAERRERDTERNKRL